MYFLYSYFILYLILSSYLKFSFSFKILQGILLQTIVSGGRRGEICFWDLRQRQLRGTLKAFDSSIVKCLITDPSNEYIIAGSSEGDIIVFFVLYYFAKFG